MSEVNKNGDIVSRPWRMILVYGVPIAAILSTQFFDANLMVVTAVLVVAFGFMGAACVINALGCGRVHCWFTGPFMLVIAMLILLQGLGWWPLFGQRGDGLTVLTNVGLWGALILTFVPEFIFGKYFQSGAR